jgi:hypothetical protein
LEQLTRYRTVKFVLLNGTNVTVPCRLDCSIQFPASVMLVFGSPIFLFPSSPLPLERIIVVIASHFGHPALAVSTGGIIMWHFERDVPNFFL